MTWPDEGRMTIGIGAICEHGETVVVASDMRATYGMTPIGPNDNCGKVFQLAEFPCVACVAGSLSSCHAVISQLSLRMKFLRRRKKISREDVMEAIDQSRIRELRRLYNWEIQKNWGISLREFAVGKVPGGKLDPLLLKAFENLLQSIHFKVEMIIAGFVGSQTMFFRASQKQSLQEEGSPCVYAIGIGQISAMRVLNRRGQHVSMSLPRTLLHVHEAMIAAHQAERRTVGHPKAYIVIRRRYGKILYIESSAPILESWRKSYKGRRTTASLDDSKIPATDIYQQLRILIPTHANEY
jgi:20S proteasome alpha/beta subunit